ncbi:MAG: PEP-CTERM sorting domain-containing protein [Bryobacteraceae bacterium]|nr:PEP-CTERM sorting domain-containing protein [Bryobacteraceae bacterium]
MRNKLLLLPAMLLVSLIPLRAAVIYDTFGSTPPGYTSPSWAIGNFAQFEAWLEVAVPFTPTDDYLLETVTIAAHLNSASPYDQLTLYVATGLTAPGAALESFTFTLSGTSLLSATSLTRPVLASGTQYWIVLSAPNLANTSGGWMISDPALRGTFASRNLNAGGNWNLTYDTLPALEVAGTALPEPSTLSLFGSGVIGLLLYRRRSSSRKVRSR